MIISPQTVSPEIAAQGVSMTAVVTENEYSLDETGGSGSDQSEFAKILAGLLKNTYSADGTLSDFAPNSRGEKEGGVEGLSPESSGSGGKRTGRKGGPEKGLPEEDGATAGSLFKNKKSDLQELFEKFPELDEESLLNEGALLGLSGTEQDAPFLAEKIPAGDEEDAWAGALALLQAAGAGDYPASEGDSTGRASTEGFWGPELADGVDGAGVFGAGEAWVETAFTGGTAETAGKEAAEAGGLKDGRSRDRKGLGGVADDAPNLRPGLENPSLMGMKKQVPAGTEGEGKNRLSEAKNRDKRREKAGLEVTDLRSGHGAEGGAEAVAKAGREIGHADEARPLSGAHQEIELTLELGQDNRGPPAGGEKTASQAFGDILARELHQNLNNDIVRHASVVLKDGGEGTIRLNLKPESLGNVKIRLEMADNKITGHIIVESDEALRAFEREVASLEQAFKDSGFEGADLEMSLASGNGDGAGQQRNNGEASPFFSERFASELAANRYDASIERTDTPWAGNTADGMKPGNGQISVNMLI